MLLKVGILGDFGCFLRELVTIETAFSHIINLRISVYFIHRKLHFREYFSNSSEWQIRIPVYTKCMRFLSGDHI